MQPTQDETSEWLQSYVGQGEISIPHGSSSAYLNQNNGQPISIAQLNPVLDNEGPYDEDEAASQTTIEDSMSQSHAHSGPLHISETQATAATDMDDLGYFVSPPWTTLLDDPRLRDLVLVKKHFPYLVHSQHSSLQS